MQNTVFITGCSSGIGKAAVEYFLAKGWNVAATVRKDSDKNLFTPSEALETYVLDVTETESIQSVVDGAISHFKKIDVVVNNAGYGLMGPFESSTPQQIQKQFATNVFGVIEVTKAFLPHFKENKGGRFITIASMFGRITLPYFSYYAASKWAVEGFTESIWYELNKYNIQVKMIEPGTIKTDFFKESIDIAKNVETSENKAEFKRLYAYYKTGGENGEPAERAAEVIYKAATESSWSLRYIVDSTARKLLSLRFLTPPELFQRLVKNDLKM